ncbi:hypothetical protein AQPW35_12780 [Rubrivivax pictus]|uniref:Uncharacterized protein n=1 Tax=Pseudaquabacterium pictum TaxID=2315236 RepID=A0A480APA1_9BURK|nr:hypothetical protein AQPW35_12780 [Rubrivivax pictus]
MARRPTTALPAHSSGGTLSISARREVSAMQASGGSAWGAIVAAAAAAPACTAAQTVGGRASPAPAAAPAGNGYAGAPSQ